MEPVKRYFAVALSAATAFLVGLFAGQSGFMSGYFEARELRAVQREAYEITLANQKWATEILNGGYILHIRHSERERWRDSATFDAWEVRNGIDASTTEWAAATCLTARGVQEAKMLGEVFRASGMRIGDVYASPVCRARQTAQNAFGSGFKVRGELLALSALWPQLRKEHSEHLRAFLQEVPIRAGTNTIMTGHGDTFSSRQVDVFDVNELRKGQERFETGFYVIERDGDRLIARHRFATLNEFANAVFQQLPYEAQLTE